MDIKEKVAIVTGGASGLGRACVETFVSKGARVAIFDRQVEQGEALVQSLRDHLVSDVRHPSPCGVQVSHSNTELMAPTK